MTPSQTCHTCGEARAIDAFKRLRSGNRAAVCTPCAKGAAAAAREADLQARLAARRRFNGARKADVAEAKESAAVAREAERAASEKAAFVNLTPEQQASQHAQRAETQRKRRENEAALRDDIWDAMRTGRYRRAVTATRPDRTGLHRIELKNGGGFITIAEFALRCAEREATHRAAATCKTFESAHAAARILERATAAVERRRELDPLWRDSDPQKTLETLVASLDETEVDDCDPFEEDFGDWAPAWVATEASSWPAYRAA